MPSPLSLPPRFTYRAMLLRSACVDVDTYFGAISSGTGEVDLGLTTRLECPKDVDTEIVIPSGAALTVKSGLDAESSVQ